mgnify:CR=1 FL=1
MYYDTDARNVEALSAHEEQERPAVVPTAPAVTEPQKPLSEITRLLKNSAKGNMVTL